MAFVPPSREYSFYEEDMSFYVTFTLRVGRVERWIRRVNEQYLDVAPTKCVGLDCGCTLAKPGSQKKLPLEERQRAAVLQLYVASEVLIFQIVHADAVPEALREFLGDDSINFCGAAVGNDVKMLEYYCITAIPGARNLQMMILNPMTKYPPSLYALSNHYIGTKLVKKDHNSIRYVNWPEFSLGYDHIKYAILDARHGFEIARKYWRLVGYNSIRDRLNE